MSTVCSKPHLWLTLGLLLILQTANAESSVLSGAVSDSTGQPVPGATVVVIWEETIVAGVAAKADGSFGLILPNHVLGEVTLQVSSVGYETSLRILKLDNLSEPIEVTLADLATQIEGITVHPNRPVELARETMSAAVVASRAQLSLVPTNPVAAIKQPQVSRPGSSHSSQIRVHGTNPVYYLNGLPIGTDPAHYGLFAFIPTLVIERIGFYPLGSPARHRLSAVVELDTREPFGGKTSADAVLSTIEATGAFKLAGERYYVLGSLRKSVLDRLVRNLDISTDRTTLPPTNFQDIFGSAGWKLSDRVRVMVDQYHVRDFLSFNTSEATGSATGVETYQSSQESQVALRLEATTDAWLTRFSVGVRSGSAFYRAIPIQRNGLYAYLTESHVVGYGRSEISWMGDHTSMTAGAEIEADREREFSLEQHNWNFLPPFSSSDNPYVYQQALNETYGDYAAVLRSLNRAAYGSARWEGSRFVFTGSLRLDDYNLLVDGTAWSPRVTIGFKTGAHSLLELRHGRYSQSPIGDILEAYQILFRANVSTLRPIRTILTSIDWRDDHWQLDLFHKHLDNLPVVTPDFENPYEKDGRLAQGVLSARSEGAGRFAGVSAAYQSSDLFGGRADLAVSYAYTHSYMIDHDVVLPYDLDAPHRVNLEVAWHLSPRFDLNTEFQWRSGYPYSPIVYNEAYDESEVFTESYYQSALESENSRRLAAHASLNLAGSYRWDRTELFLSISNLTNRANPIVNSSSGPVYDAGILPMLGVRVRL
jgi:hypothetical protein